MDLNFEYNQDLVIEGHACVLNHVENIEKADHYLIRRHFISADGKFRTFFDKRVAKAVPATTPGKAAAGALPGKPAPKIPVTPPKSAPAPEPTPTGLDTPAAEAAPPAEEKRGTFSRLFGGKKKGKK